MRKINEEARYSENMEWLVRKGEEVVIGLSDFAQKAAGQISFIELPKVGEHFAREAVFAVAESDKMANEITLPIAGTIIAINSTLPNNPKPINEDPYGAGWLVRIKPDDESAIDQMMNAEDFEKYIGVFFK